MSAFLGHLFASSSHVSTWNPHISTSTFTRQRPCVQGFTRRQAASTIICVRHVTHLTTTRLVLSAHEGLWSLVRWSALPRLWQCTFCIAKIDWSHALPSQVQFEASCGHHGSQRWIGRSPSACSTGCPT